MAAWRDSLYPWLVIVAPDTESMWALCAFRVSVTSSGTAHLVCGWCGACSIRTAAIRSPRKVTSTWKTPFTVSTAVPGTTLDAEEDDGDEGDDVDDGDYGTVAGVDAGRAMSAVPVDGW